uniref:Uncharacterized protein n=1 Tax=Ditylenchus dipsaci TaxID=166011 RepID=A0A915CRI9_9BILA
MWPVERRMLRLFLICCADVSRSRGYQRRHAKRERQSDCKQQERSEEGQFPTTGTAYGTQGITTFHQQQPATGYEDPVTGYGIGGNVHGTYESNLPEEKGTLEKAKDKVWTQLSKEPRKFNKGQKRSRTRSWAARTRQMPAAVWPGMHLRQHQSQRIDGQGNKISDYRTDRTDVAPNL